jgi:hypothetical protein
MKHPSTAQTALRALAVGSVLAFASSAWAKLPPPSDEAKAKAAEAAAKTAHGNKVADYKLCQSMDKVAAYYYASSKKAGKETKRATATPACADPGAFVYPPPDPNAPAAAAAPAQKAAPAPAQKTAAAAAPVATAAKKP